MSAANAHNYALPSRIYTQNTGARSTPLVWSFLAVEDWVELRVVVHLHLAVKLEAALAGEDLGPEAVEAVGQVAALLFEDRETTLIAEAVVVSGAFAQGLFAGVVDLQGEDGEAVNDEARRLGIKGRGAVLVGDCVEESFVDLLDEVVAALVEAVDGVLDGGNVLSRSAHIAGHVFLVPEVEVGAVLGDDGCHQDVPGRAGGMRGRENERAVLLGVVVQVGLVGMMGSKIVPLVSGHVVAPNYEMGVNHISARLRQR